MRMYRSLPHIGGLHTAYQAYKERTKYDKDAKPLIGVNLTPDQVFFVAAAQVSSRTNCFTLKITIQKYTAIRDKFFEIMDH